MATRLSFTTTTRSPATSRASSLPIPPHQFPAPSPVLACPALYWQVVAFSAGGDGVVNPHEPGVIDDGLVIAATRFLGRAAASVRSSCPARKRQGTGPRFSTDPAARFGRS